MGGGRVSIAHDISTTSPHHHVLLYFEIECPNTLQSAVIDMPNCALTHEYIPKLLNLIANASIFDEESFSIPLPTTT